MRRNWLGEQELENPASVLTIFRQSLQDFLNDVFFYPSRDRQGELFLTNKAFLFKEALQQSVMQPVI